MSETDNAKKPKFTLAFKQDAVKLVLEKGYSHQQAADSLGVSLSALGRWVRAERSPEALPETKAQTMILADHDELVRLRKENEQLRMEREIIKKAAAFFAKELG
jgi:transposase